MLKYIIGMLLLCGSITALSAQLPKTLEGTTFIFQVVGEYNPKDNPNAGAVYKMSFDQHKYHYTVLSSQTHYQGKYSYQRKNVNGVYVGVIKLAEYDSKNPTNYYMILVGDGRSGYYIYKQTQGAIKPNQRLNVAKYYITIKPKVVSSHKN